MNRIPIQLQKNINNLRRSGKSILEIVNETGAAKTTVQRYVKSVKIPGAFQILLKEKQGGAKDRAIELRRKTSQYVMNMLGNLEARDYFVLLIALYWGEGTKRDLSLINSDPYLLQSFLWCLRTLGVKRERISLSLRVHSDISIYASKVFWSKTLKFPKRCINRVEVINGKKKGKLPYGMCRIRVKSGIRERLIIQSAIKLIGKQMSEKVLSN